MTNGPVIKIECEICGVVVYRRNELYKNKTKCVKCMKQTNTPMWLQEFNKMFIGNIELDYLRPCTAQELRDFIQHHITIIEEQAFIQGMISKKQTTWEDKLRNWYVSGDDIESAIRLMREEMEKLEKKITNSLPSKC